ncbi:MAG TPA: S24 family peptidase [Bryobacteraceae bacterium]|jgi:SOS-response transcriptional repressor LexA
MSVATTYAARVSILELELPGQPPVAAGILLEDPSQDRLHLRLRRDWDQIAPGEAVVLSAVEFDLAAKASELGAARLLALLEDTMSNVLRITDPRETVVDDFDRALARLYREHVRSTVRPFVTHLPRYSLTVAAGKFLENQEVAEQAWEEAPPGLKLTPDLFAARIAGHSMEPHIPDASLCVFRAGVAGSRQGRLVLVEALGRGANDRYTVKRYRSEKSQRPDGSWEHDRIRLEPLNPEFEAWDLDPEKEDYRVIAEFVRVLD